MTLTSAALARFVGYESPVTPPVPVARDVATRDGMVVEALAFHVGGERVRATYIRPEGPGPFAAVLYCHAHGGEWDIGMRELLEGRAHIPTPLGPAFVAAGLAALCVEMPCFGDRAAPGESERAKTHLYRARRCSGRC